jgi:autotransporter-associated beta strand protein
MRNGQKLSVASNFTRKSLQKSKGVLCLAAAGALAAVGHSTAMALDTADYVNLNAVAALDTAANFSTAALPTATNDMVFTNGTYTNTAFTLNTTALTPGTLNDLDATQSLVITGSKSITLKTAASAQTAFPADLLYVANGANLNTSNAIALGVSGNFDIAGTTTLSGIVSGAFALTKTANGTLNLSAAESYTGATTLSAGTLNLNFGSAVASNILLSTGTMTLQNGILNMNGAASAANTQTVGAVTLNNGGLVQLNLNPGTSGSTTFTMASLTRTTSANSDAVGGAIQFGTNGTAVITGTLSSAILVDASSNPFATYGTDNWAATNSTGGVIAAATTAYTDWTASTSISAISPVATRFNNSSSQITINNGNTTSTLRGILVPSFSQGGTITGGFIRPNRASTAGAQLLVAENAAPNATPGGVGDLTIASVLSVASTSTPVALVKTGPGRLILSNTGNAQARNFIDGGLLSVSADANLGAAGGDLVFNGGTLEVTSSFTPATNRAMILNSNSGVSITGSSSFTENGYVSGIGSLTKSGTGTLTLTAGNSFWGGTTVTAGTLNINGFYALGGANYGGLTLNGGTLQYATNLAGVNSGAGNGGADLSNYGGGFTIGASGGTMDLNGNPVSYGGSLHDGGGILTVTSTDASHAGVLTLTGNSSLASGIAVNNAGLLVTGALTNTPVSVSSGGTLSGTGSVGALNIAGGTVITGVGPNYLGQLTASSVTYNSGTIQVGIGSSTSGNISTGSATFNATPTFGYTLSGTPAPGTYTVFSSTNPISGSSFLTPALLGSKTIGRLTFTPSEVGNTIVVTLTGNPGNLVWNNGAGTGAWNITTDANFLNTGTSSNDKFNEGDLVTFNDSNGGSANYTVGIAGTVDPSSVTVNNSGGTYTFNGPGAINGSTGITKYGSSSLILNNNNTYTGVTTINAGTVQTGVANALSSASTLVVQGTGTLDLAGNNQTVAGLSDGGISTGTITTSTGSATLTVNASTNTTYSGSITGALGITKIGNSTLTLAGTNSYTGQTNVAAGTLAVTSNSGLGNATSTSGGLLLASPGIVSFNAPASAIASLTGTSGSVVLAYPTGTTLTIGGGNATTSFGGVISDASATTSTAVGNLTMTGSGNLTLNGANTFTGQTVIGGTSTLTLGNSLALQDSTLNYNGQGGNISFGTLTSATIGALNGSQGLSLVNNAAAAVTLTVGNNNTSATYSGVLTGSGSLTKAGSGELVLSGSNTYTGNTATAANGGLLTVTGTVGAGASQGAVTVGDSSTLNVSGGTIIASAFYGDAKGYSTVNVTSGGTINVSSGALQLNANNGAAGFAFNLLDGTVTANSVLVDRSGATAGELTTDPVGDGGLTINGSNAVLHVITTLGLDTALGADNSSAYVTLYNGTLNVDGLTTISLVSTASRNSALDVAGGTFNGSGGVQIGTANSGSSYLEFLIHGGVANVSGITLGATGQTTGTNALLLEGGKLFIGGGGIVNNAPAGPVNIINLGSTAYATAPVLAASAPWTSSVPMTLANTTAGLAPTIQTADASGNSQNISLSGALTGTGGLNVTGTGVLTLSGVNTYSGATNVAAGTLAAGSATGFSSASAFNVTGGTLDASAYSNAVASLNVGPAGTLNLNLAVGSVLAVTGAANFDGHLSLVGVPTSVPETLMTYGSVSDTFPIGNVTGVPAADKLVYVYNGINELELVAGGPAALTWTGSVSNNWNTTQANWINSSTSAASNYSDTSNPTLGTGDSVAFNDGSGSYSVSISGSSVNPTSVTFNNSVNPYTITGSGVGIAGAGSVTLTGSSTVTLNATNTYTGGTNVSNGTLIIASASAFPNNGSTGTALTVGAGAVFRIASHSTGGTSTEPIISSLNNGGLIDITNNEILIKGSTYTAVSNEVSSAYTPATGLWKTAGNGLITSSTVGGLTTVGVAAVSGGIEVKATYYGDALLTGSVTSADYTTIDNGFLNTLTGWQNGDFNYDGFVNGSDYTLIDNAFNTQGAQLQTQFATATAQIAGGSGASSAVPEPTSLGLLALGSLGLLGRRNRRRN